MHNDIPHRIDYNVLQICDRVAFIEIVTLQVNVPFASGLEVFSTIRSVIRGNDTQ